MRRNRWGCCARAAIGHTAALPSPAINSLRRIRDPPSRFNGSLSRSRMQGNGYVTGLVIEPKGPFAAHRSAYWGAPAVRQHCRRLLRTPVFDPSETFVPVPGCRRHSHNSRASELRKQRVQCGIDECIVGRIHPEPCCMPPDRRDWPQFSIGHLRRPLAATSRGSRWKASGPVASNRRWPGTSSTAISGLQ